MHELFRKRSVATPKVRFYRTFRGRIGSADNTIDVLSFVHHNISFEEAERGKNIFVIQQGLLLNIVPYRTLQEMKPLSHRGKDMFDVASLEEIREKSGEKPGKV